MGKLGCGEAGECVHVCVCVRQQLPITMFMVSQHVCSVAIGQGSMQRGLGTEHLIRSHTGHVFDLCCYARQMARSVVVLVCFSPSPMSPRGFRLKSLKTIVLFAVINQLDEIYLKG